MKRVLLFLVILFLTPLGAWGYMVDSGIVALRINPDESITVINKGVLDGWGADPEKGAFEEVTFKPENKQRAAWEQENRHRNMTDDHVYDYTEYKGIRKGKALIERTQGHRGPGGINSYENTFPFEIAPFTLIDYANNEAKEKEVWYGITHMSNADKSQFVQQFIEYWIKNHGKEAFHQKVSQSFLDPSANTKFLLSLGADINVTDENGENVLFRIIKGGYSGKLVGEYYSVANISYKTEYIIFIKGLYLFSNGLDPYHKNNKGETIFDILRQSKKGDDKRLLEYIECELSPDHELIRRDSHVDCYQKCGSDSFRGKDMKCYPCNALEKIVADSSECDRCPDRKFRSDSRDSFCYLKECPEGYFKDESEGYFKDGFGSCISCDTPRLDASRNRCPACKNWEIRNGRCVLKTCPSGTFRNKDDNCQKCDIEEPYIKASDEECSQCPNLESSNGCCYPKSGKKYIRNTVGHCIPLKCDDPHRVLVYFREEDCNKCPNRIYDDEHNACVLKDSN